MFLYTLRDPKSGIPLSLLKNDNPKLPPIYYCCKGPPPRRCIQTGDTSGSDLINALRSKLDAKLFVSLMINIGALSEREVGGKLNEGELARAAQALLELKVIYEIDDAERAAPLDKPKGRSNSVEKRREASDFKSSALYRLQVRQFR
jgi:hypothetical protein